MTLLDRVLAKVDQSGGPNACHPWLGGLSHGKPVISFDGTSKQPRRVIWEAVRGACCALGFSPTMEGHMKHLNEKVLEDTSEKRDEPRPPVRPPTTEEEWRAWDTFAAAALTGSLWWNQHKPIMADDPAKDAALIADEMLELRRKRKRNAS